MNKIIQKISLVSLVVLWGCGGLGFFTSVPPVEEEEAVQFVDSGKIVQRKLLSEGGNLLIVPFSPGVNVAADDDANREALLIVKGMVEVLRDNPFSLNVLSAEDADQATILIVGRMTDKTAPGKLKRWLPGDDPIEFAVQGKMVLRENRLPILEFSHRVESQGSDGSYDEMAVTIGRDIGNFILSAMQEGVSQ